MSLLLTATDQSLELVTSSDADVDWTTHYADHDAATPAFTPLSNQGTVSAAQTTTIVAAPASGLQRQVKGVTVRNRDATDSVVVRVQKDVNATNYRLTPEATLLPGESFNYVDNAGWRALDANGRLKERDIVVGPIPQVVQAPHFATANLTSTKTLTTTQCFAVYLGPAPRSLSAVQFRFRVTTAAATITWAEVAIAKGLIVLGGNPQLTPVGFADVAGNINSTGLKSITVNVSAGQQIAEADQLWFLIGNQATTAGVVRAQSIADDIQVGYQGSVAVRPSTIIGAAFGFTIEGATVLAPWVAAAFS